jgi:hypothetical protein
MSVKHIISEIEKTDAEVYEKISDRRDMLSSFGAKVALAALPFAIGSMFNKASAQTTDTVVDVLNMLLEMKFLKYTYYRQATNTGGLIPASEAPGFKAIENQEKMHVTFLENLITEMGGVPFKPKYYTASTTIHPYVPAAYDFTSGGKYVPFSDYASFLTLASVFEDTCIHAMQGQIVTLQTNNTVLQKIVSMQAVDGRHAAYTRLMRRLAVNAPETPTPWIQNNIPPSIPLQKYYLGEDNTTQKGVDIAGLPNVYYDAGAMPMTAATAAFDEGYDKTTVMTLMAPFKKI